MFGGTDTCPVIQPGSFLIGRTEYNIMMFDTRTKDRRWNITYYDYSCNIDSRVQQVLGYSSPP
jgi:serine/threonine-protein kinase/endoribonuclease IRE1